MSCGEHLRKKMETETSPKTTERKFKFGGMSFGGKYGGCRIFGNKYFLTIGREKKTMNFGYAVEKLRPRNMIMKFFFIFFFFMIDGIVWIADHPPRVLIMFFDWIESAADNIGNAVSPVLPNVQTSPTFDLVASIVFFTICCAIFYMASFRGVRRWHGLEHKSIAAAEQDDIANYEKYGVVNDRCGGTFLLSIYAYLLISICFVVFVLGVPGYGAYTMTAVMMYAEAKWFHQYNVIGIWFGRKLQKHASTREPWDWQKKIGKEAITQLLNAERGEPFREKNVLFTKKLEAIENVG
jgi:hypothetical protein